MPMEVENIYTKTPAWTVYIKYRGVWDFDDLYKVMVDWFKDKKFNFQEVFHKSEKFYPYGTEEQYKWTAARREEEYMQYNIWVHLRTYDTEKFTVTQPGGKQKVMTKGRLWIEFGNFLLYDFERNFDKSAFYSHLRNFMHKYIYKKKLEAIWWDQMYYREMHKLHALVKERLKMESRSLEHRYWMGVHR